MFKQKKKLALVLGGGGARSFAHLGIYSVLEKENIRVDCIASSSMGSIMAVLIADQVPIKLIKEEFYKLTNRISWLKPDLSRSSFISQNNIKKILRNLLKTKNIEDLAIKVRIVATNLDTGELKVFDKGNIIEAVCASSAFPGLYKPVNINNEYYVDGGILNNVPADIARKCVKQKNIVLSSKLEGKFFNLHHRYNSFAVVWRSIYIPLIKAREEIVEENSDIILEPLKNVEFNFKNWRDILKFYNKNLMESYYRKGQREMRKHIEELKNKLS